MIAIHFHRHHFIHTLNAKFGFFLLFSLPILYDSTIAMVCLCVIKIWFFLHVLISIRRYLAIHQRAADTDYTITPNIPVRMREIPTGYYSYSQYVCIVNKSYLVNWQKLPFPCVQFIRTHKMWIISLFVSIEQCQSHQSLSSPSLSLSRCKHQLPHSIFFNILFFVHF